MTLRALADLDVVLSACPQDVLRINGGAAHPAADRAAVSAAPDARSSGSPTASRSRRCRASSTAGDGVATDAMADYYAEFARGGFGLDRSARARTSTPTHSQAYPNQPAIVTDEQVRAWARVVDAVHEAGGTIFLQLMHAGALVQTGRAGVAPSAVQPLGRMLRGYGGAGPYPLPRELTVAEIDDGRGRVRDRCRAGARRPASTASRSTPPTATCSTSSSRPTRTAAPTPTAPTARGVVVEVLQAIDGPARRPADLAAEGQRPPLSLGGPGGAVRSARAGAPRVRARGQRGRELGGVLAAGLGRQPDRARAARVRRAGDRQRRPGRRAAGRARAGRRPRRPRLARPRRAGQPRLAAPARRGHAVRAVRPRPAAPGGDDRERAQAASARWRPENGYWRMHAPASSCSSPLMLAVPASAEAGTLLSVPAAGGRPTEIVRDAGAYFDTAVLARRRHVDRARGARQGGRRYGVFRAGAAPRWRRSEDDAIGAEFAPGCEARGRGPLRVRGRSAVRRRRPDPRDRRQGDHARAEPPVARGVTLAWSRDGTRLAVVDVRARTQRGDR